MRPKPTAFVEQQRIKTGLGASDASYGNNGAFEFSCGSCRLFVVASDEGGWEHVSVHTIEETGDRCPTWEEMDYVRKLFFRGDEWVMQLHAPVTKNINRHPHTLHMWRPLKESIPTPPRWMV